MSPRPSNGTEGEAWMEAWCRTCIKDVSEDCQILLEGLMGGEPEQWHRGPMWSPQTVIYCTEYKEMPQKWQPTTKKEN